MIKKISIILTSLFLIILSYQIFNDDINQLPQDSKIEAFEIEEKLSDGILKSDKKDKIEKEIKKNKNPKKTNKKKISLEKEKNKKLSKNKNILFLNPKDEKIVKNEYKFSNKKNDDWETELRNRLLDSLDNKPELTIKKEKSLIEVLKDKARYIEQAQIIIDHEDGRQDSFRALIDSESGKILRSWDRTIHENFLKKPRKFSPSGNL